MSTPPLIRVSCRDKVENIGIETYADMVVFDSEKTLVAMRIGGYPESVQAMSQAIQTGCNLELKGKRETFHVQTKGGRKYEKRTSHDGIYAEGMFYLKDDTAHSLSLDDDERSEKEAVALKQNLYFFCRDDDELYQELDKKLSVPLIPEFKEYFLSELKRRKLLKPLQVYCIGRKFDGWEMSISDNEAAVIKVLEDGLKSGTIEIPGGKNGNQAVFANIKSFTDYLHDFGTMIADRIKQNFPPRYNPAEESICTELKEVNQYVIDHAGYSLFDAQLGAAEGLKRQLQKDKMALLVAECGTGKSATRSLLKRWCSKTILVFGELIIRRVE